MLMNPEGIDLPQSIATKWKKMGEKADIELFIQKMKYLNLRNSVFIDCTAEASVTSTYISILSSFVSIVTANKIACSSETQSLQGTEEDRKGKECEVHV